MNCDIIINDATRWAAPSWLVQNLVAHVVLMLGRAQLKSLESFLSREASRNPPNLDLREFSDDALLAFYRSTLLTLRLASHPTERWHDPESRDQFLIRVSELVAKLETDNRIAGRPVDLTAATLINELGRAIRIDERWQATGCVEQEWRELE